MDLSLREIHRRGEKSICSLFELLARFRASERAAQPCATISSAFTHEDFGRFRFLVDPERISTNRERHLP